MHVGSFVGFTNLFDTLPDRQVIERDLVLAHQIEPLGFDSCWTVEHHFTDYQLMPNPLQFLSYMAGRTSRIKLGSGAVILPWHDPRRVVEQAVLLDHLSDGRLILGLGRGIGRIEYEGYGIEMDTAMERYLDYLEFLLDSFDTGVMEADGAYFQMPRRELRPRPFASLRERTYCATQSPDSMERIARLGLGIITVVQKPWAKVKEDNDRYTDVFAQVHGAPPPPPIIACQVIVDESADRAAELSYKYTADYYKSVVRHYEFDKPVHGTGFEFYRGIASHIERVGLDAAARAFADLSPSGTPQQVCDRIRDIHDLFGIGGFLAHFSFGGMPLEIAAGSQGLFAREVLPELKRIPTSLPFDAPLNGAVADGRHLRRTATVAGA